jgi:outer membrane receptor protein involved in Fe transport
MFQIETPYGEQNLGSEISLFGQDTWTIKNRLTLTLGLRWDRSNSRYPAQKRAASYWAGLVDPGDTGAASNVFEEANRSRGSFCSSVPTSSPKNGETSDARSDSRAGVSFRCADITATAPSRWNGFSPDASS